MRLPIRSGSKFSIRYHLISLVLLAVIPVSIFSTGLINFLADQQAESLQSNLLGTAKTLRVAVDEQILAVTSSLQVLAEVEDFGPSRIQYLHSKLRSFVEHQPHLVSISLTDSRGRQIFNTMSNYGKRLPSFGSESFFSKMLNEKSVVISGVRNHTVHSAKVVSIAVPVLRHSSVIYSLIASLDVEAFSKLLSKKNLPATWRVLISSKQGVVIATSSKDRGAVGSRVTELRRELGQNNLTSETQSRLTGWSVQLLVPDEGYLYGSWKSTHVFFAGLFFFILLSIGFALVMGRKISQPIRDLSSSARRLGEGRNLKKFEASFVEVSDVHAALQQASELRRQSEDRIKHLYQEAREAVTIRDTFLSMASHELKTPLTSLKLQFDILDRRIEAKPHLTKEELTRPITRVQEQIKRLVLLIDDLLDVTRISSGKLEYHLETLDLYPVAREIASQMNGASSFPLITLTGDHTLIGSWDRHRIEQILINLLSNALKYGKGKSVVLDLRQRENHVQIEVQDQGVGISAEDLLRVFEKFERVGDRKLVSGLGLGLWIVKNIVEGMGGEISVESQPGAGSTFRVSLPCFAVSVEGPSASLSSPGIVEEQTPIS